MTCICGHPKHHHTAHCATTTIHGDPTPPAYWGAAAELHLGRTITRCHCGAYQPASGDQLETTNTHTQERVVQ